MQPQISKFQVTLSLSEKATLADAMTAMRALPECQTWRIDAQALGVFGKSDHFSGRLPMATAWNVIDRSKGIQKPRDSCEPTSKS